MVEMFVQQPYAEIITNDIISKPIKINRGCRPVCPLSPVLLISAVEPLAIAVWERIKITIGGPDHRIALYTDNIIVFLKKTWKTLFHPF